MVVDSHTPEYVILAEILCVAESWNPTMSVCCAMLYFISSAAWCNSDVLFCIIDDKHLCIKSETPIAQHLSNTSTIKRNLTTHSADCSFQKKIKEIKKKIWIVEYLIVALATLLVSINALKILARRSTNKY